MRYVMEEKLKLAIIYCTHADRASKMQQQILDAFIADCKAKKVFVCVFESGDGNLLENTKELLIYNHNNVVTNTT